MNVPDSTPPEPLDRLQLLDAIDTHIKCLPVLLKQKTKRWTRFYLPPASATAPRMPWGTCKRLLKQLGYPNPIRPSSEILLNSSLADALILHFKPEKSVRLAC